MYCRKCGTEQKDGQKYCPKCGEPFLDENGKPYLKGIRKDLQDAKDKLASKADELTQQGKKLVEEKVQPQLNELTQKGKNLVEEKVQPKLNEKIDELKKVDWEEKKTESVKSMRNFFSNAYKLRIATIIIALIVVLWFFIFNHGFSASWIWWLLAICFVVAAFYKDKTDTKAKELQRCRLSLGLTILFGLVFVFHSPSGHGALESMDNGGINVKAKNAKEEETLMKMAKIYGQIKETLPQVEALYNAHRQFVSQGGNPNFSPAWGKWQDCRDKIMDLWDEYIRLARQLDDNEEIIEQAKESKRKQDRAFKEMFVPHL